MSSEEQKQILKMVEDGKISAQEALKLIQALDGPAVDGEVVTSPESDPGPAFSKPQPQEFEEVARKAQGLWQVILGIGVSIVVLSAFWLYSLVNNSNYGFWFYCAILPLLFGVLLIALFTGSRASRWLYVNVKQTHVDWPQNITLGIPLPLGLAGWFLKNFGHSIDGLDQAAVDEILEFLSTGLSSREPVIVNVDQGEGGEHVQVYIG